MSNAELHDALRVQRRALDGVPQAHRRGGQQRGSPAEQLEADLIALYQSAPPQASQGFGWHQANYIGALPQPNRWHANFADFYWNERLEPQLRMAMERGLLDAAIERIACAVGCGPGFRERVAYWQIHPLLVHINLFGQTYAAQFQQAVSRYL